VEDQAFQTPTIAKRVQYKKKIEMDVKRLSIWVVQRLSYFMNERNMALRSGDQPDASTKREFNNI